jgi:hypothetical protein
LLFASMDGAPLTSDSCISKIKAQSRHPIAMAVFKWMSRYPSYNQHSELQNVIENLGLAINDEISNPSQLFATNPNSARLKANTRITVLATWIDRNNHDLQVEVRSDEPMLRSGTRCEQIAKALQQSLPPKTSDLHTP